VGGSEADIDAEAAWDNYLLEEAELEGEVAVEEGGAGLIG
jgi:hypothetical protein